MQSQLERHWRRLAQGGVGGLLLTLIVLGAAVGAPATDGKQPAAGSRAARLEARSKKLGKRGEREPATLPPASAPATFPPEAIEKASRSRLSFDVEVMPILDKHGCSTAACHGATGPSRASGSNDGKDKLTLSLFGAYPADDYAAIVKDGPNRLIDPVEPDKSLLLAKVTNKVTHEGGRLIQPGSPEWQKLQAWLREGTPLKGGNAPEMVSLEVNPKTVQLDPGGTCKLAVTLALSDGQKRDVTADAAYRCSDPAGGGRVRGLTNGQTAGRFVCRLDDPSPPVKPPSGGASIGGSTIKAARPGQCHIIVSYRRRMVVVPVLVPTKIRSGSPEVPFSNRIDELVSARLQTVGIPPSPASSDAEFVRRVYLDTIGLLPAVEEAKSFLDDRAADKRSKLIDKLLQREEFADRWALKWGDLLRIKSEYPSNVWPNGVQAYHRWLRQAIATNKPYDQFARELLVSSGSDFRDGPANYYRALRRRDPQGFAEVTSLVFMGARLDCARCHAHPTENWTRDDNLGVAAFFAQVQFKGTQEWKEEIVLLDPERVLRDPVSGRVVAPKPLGGQAIAVRPGDDPRVAFADWLTAKDNPWFARNIVNRVWFWLMGRGIIHEVDDVRASNPPSNPELLAYLERELIGHKYDLRHIYRLILNSRVYQLTSETQPLNATDTTLFSHHPVKRLDAEQLLDAINQVAGTSDEYSSNIPEPYTFLPKGMRAGQIADGSIGSTFLEMFGRPTRDSAYESERCTRVSMAQSVYLTSSPQLDAKIAKGSRLNGLLKSGRSDAELVDEIYLSALSRPTTEDEKRKVLVYLSERADRRQQAFEDVMWAALNTKEFLFNH